MEKGDYKNCRQLNIALPYGQREFITRSALTNTNSNEQTSSRHRANIKHTSSRPDGTRPPGSNV